MDENLKERLEREAKFQNSRTKASTAGKKEARLGFYFLADNARQQYANEVISLIKDKRVLIVGCAEGGVTPAVRAGVKHVVGIDIADAPISKINKLINEEGLQDRAEAFVMNAESPDFPPNSFDVIFCTGVLHHLDITESCKSWSRILSKDGCVIMLEPMAYNPFIALFRCLTPQMRTPDEHPLVPSDFRIMKSYFKSVRKDGFVLSSLIALPFGFIPGIPTVARNVRDIFEVIDRALIKLFPFLNYFCWTCLIVLKEPTPDVEGRSKG